VGWKAVMTENFNRKSEIYKRRELRKNPTLAEKILWQHLKGRQLVSFKFRRQYSVNQFVIDFYCSKVKLAIELDGSVHNSETAQIYDKEREEIIKSFDITFLRYKNEAIYNDLDNVLYEIETKLKELEKKPPLTPPS
jgi:very-short-patch-repair endonuclease